MSTVFMRAGGEPLADTTTPTIPRLSELARVIAARQPWLRNESISVDLDTFEAAETEMVTHLKTRGYSRIQRAEIPERNFLLMGVPVICKDS